MILNKIRELAAWGYTRFQKGYSTIGGVMNAFNFAGIFTLLLTEPLGIRAATLFPIILIIGIMGIVLFSIFMFDWFNFQTVVTKNSGMMDDYWHKRLVPMDQKALLVQLDAINNIGNKEKIEQLKEKVRSGFI